MEALFGCEGVRDRLFLLATLDAEGLARREPEAARHLSWCLGCRDRLAEIVVTERLAGSGAFEGDAGPAGGWREVVLTAGKTALELAGRLVVRVGAATAAFASVPAGLVPMPEPLLAGVRGGRSAAPDAAVRRVRLDGDVPRVELALQPRGTDRADLDVLLAHPAEPRTLRVLVEKPSAPPELVAVQPLRPDEVARVRALAPGAYLLELTGSSAPVLRIGFDVEAPPA